MPIELGVWKLGAKPERIQFTGMEQERFLEDAIVDELGILAPDLLLIGRQIPTIYNKFIDLLAINGEGNLIIAELKRDRTPRDVVAQLLDYATWAQRLSYEDITDLYVQRNPEPFEKAFAEFFGRNPPDEINQSHELIVVANELDPSTERIVSYLADNYGVPINVMFFRYFRDGDNQYLARTWLIDPMEAELKTAKARPIKGKEPWNGKDFYVSLGEGKTRNWDDCKKYGFISAGQGKWYSRTLKQLFVGARIFVHIPGTGYVGVGTVTQEACPVGDFTIELNGKHIPILDAPLATSEMNKNSNNLDLCEYMVRVQWIVVKQREEFYWETGLFANQNSVCKLTNQFTLTNLIRHFGVGE